MPAEGSNATLSGAQMTLAELGGRPSAKGTVLSTGDIDRLIDANAVVAFGVSGGKDSTIGVAAGVKYLDSRGHKGKRVLVHADLGIVEWDESILIARELSKLFGMDLIVVGEGGPGLMDRWESRWQSSVRRYSELSTVTVVLPWSTPSMRFCTSEKKSKPIEADLARRFKGQHVINVTGIRREESTNRAKSAIASKNEARSNRGVEVWNWRPVLDWTVDEVFEYHVENNLPLHPGYTKYGMSRISCRFCIMSSMPDLLASSRRPEHAGLLCRMVDLEIKSTFAFQGTRWLGDIAPAVIGEARTAALILAKDRARRRKAVEARIPKELLFVQGWPTRMVTRTEASLLAEVRNEVAEILDLEIQCRDADSVMARYEYLLSQKKSERVAA